MKTKAGNCCVFLFGEGSCPPVQNSRLHGSSAAMY
jgi:hypothetical protein